MSSPTRSGGARRTGPPVPLRHDLVGNAAPGPVALNDAASTVEQVRTCADLFLSMGHG